MHGARQRHEAVRCPIVGDVPKDLQRTERGAARFLHQKFVVTLNRTVRGAEGVMLVSLWPNS